MDLLENLFNLILNLDKGLVVVIDNFGSFTYLILFVVIFIETGLVVTPFLPGDSLLFAAGTFAAKGALNPILLFLLLSFAAVLGDSFNYWIGALLGQKAFEKESRFFKKSYLIKTHEFYEKHGGKTIVLARFIPIIRTFAPFVAGIGKMSYSRFLSYNILGGVVWVGVFVTLGFKFNNLPAVKNNFSLVILAIILVSLLPGLIEYLRHKKASS